LRAASIAHTGYCDIFGPISGVISIFPQSPAPAKRAINRFTEPLNHSVSIHMFRDSSGLNALSRVIGAPIAASRPLAVMPVLFSIFSSIGAQKAIPPAVRKNPNILCQMVLFGPQNIISHVASTPSTANDEIAVIALLPTGRSAISATFCSSVRKRGLLRISITPAFCLSWIFLRANCSSGLSQPRRNDFSPACKPDDSISA
jgi:hypothetical protein